MSFKDSVYNSVPGAGDRMDTRPPAFQKQRLDIITMKETHDFAHAGNLYKYDIMKTLWLLQRVQDKRRKCWKEETKMRKQLKEGKCKTKFTRQ